jgi:hypothetical protein
METKRDVRVEKPYKGQATRQVIDFYEAGDFAPFTMPDGTEVSTPDQFCRGIMDAEQGGPGDSRTATEKVTIADGVPGYAYARTAADAYRHYDVCAWHGNSIYRISQLWGYYQTAGTAKDPLLDIPLQSFIPLK